MSEINIDDLGINPEDFKNMTDPMKIMSTLFTSGGG